jgi:hypothetical protein
MQVNMHSVVLVAYEVVLEPMARFAPYSNESFRGQDRFRLRPNLVYDYWLLVPVGAKWK